MPVVSAGKTPYPARPTVEGRETMPPSPKPSQGVTSRGVPGWLVILGILTAIGPLSIDMYLPAFPQILAALGGQPGSVEFTLASYFIGLTAGQLFYGPLSDRFGRKPLLYVGFSLYALASVGSALADSIPVLTALRFIQGMGGCAGTTLPAAIVRDRSGARESAQAFSKLLLVMGVAPIIAPLFGGFLLRTFDWRAIFVTLAGFGALCLLLIRVGLAESHDTRHEPPLRLGRVLRNYAFLLRNRTYLGYALGGGLVMSGMFAYIAGSPFVLIDLYHIAPQDYGWYFGANAFGLIASSQINARVLRKVPATTVLRRALVVPPLVGITLVALAWSGLISLPWVLAGFFLFVSSIGWITPNAIASALATHGQMAGTAAALSSAMQFLVATLAGSLVGLLHDGTARPLVTVMAVCGCGAFLCHRLLVKQHGETAACP
jgi:DHA1 family bicyclomycin/chloramphenicol resistance-like MFS transporter